MNSSASDFMKQVKKAPHQKGRGLLIDKSKGKFAMNVNYDLLTALTIRARGKALQVKKKPLDKGQR